LTNVTFEGGTIEDEEPLEDWIQRSRYHPFKIGLVSLAQVFLSFRGGSHPLASMAVVTKEEFTVAAK
jgi:hypothetical protein